MAFLYVDSFTSGAGELPGIVDDKNALFTRLKLVLLDISGPPVNTSYGDLYPKPPRGLDRRRDQLKRNYKKTWDDTIIAFDFETYGATSNHRTLEINIGEFFFEERNSASGSKKGRIARIPASGDRPSKANASRADKQDNFKGPWVERRPEPFRNRLSRFGSRTQTR